MAVITEEQATTVSGEPVDGWETRMMAATNRNMRWADIVCELIDNARSYSKPGQPAVVDVSWATRPRQFQVVDAGEGGHDPTAFLRPGLSGGEFREAGNSTYGTGLFAVECHLKAKMTICTFPCEGNGLIIKREVTKGRDGTSTAVDNTADRRSVYKVPGNGGTRVVFDGIHKRIPTESQAVEIATELGEKYAYAIRAGELIVSLRRGDSSRAVTPAAIPLMEQQNTTQITSDGHLFKITWGLTTAPNHTPGVELIYGGKQFEVTSIPCGEFNVKFFFGSITIPRSFGKDSMDLLKRNIDSESMSEVYDRCYELFKDALEESHKRSTTKELNDLNQAIARILSDESDAKPDGDDKPGTQDKRKFNGRDPNGDGVEPKDTGRNRTGRRGGRRNAKGELPINVQWQPLGVSKDIAIYDASSNRLTYNEDNAKAMAWREGARTESLAVVGASFMAQELKNDTGYGNFGHYMTKLCNRLS